MITEKWDLFVLKFLTLLRWFII